jgi:putative salt-induced outer membrane protein YdiY
MINRNTRKSQNVFLRVVWVCLISCCFLAVNLEVYAAQQNEPSVESQTKGKDEKKRTQPWEPPPPPPDEFDWIQLKSGEWLKGEFKVLYGKKLEFDSDELDLLEFDWEDVKQVRGARTFAVRFVGPLTVIGLLQVTPDKVYVTVGEERQEYNRSQLVAIAPAAQKEIGYWSAKVDLGLNITSGNTRQTQYSTIANIKRRSSKTRFVTDYLGNYTRTEDVDTVDNQRVNTYFDIFKTRKYFFRPFFGEYYRDPFKNIKNRITFGAGIGYHIIDTSKTEWNVAGGPAYQHTRFDSVEVGQASSESTPALVLGTLFNRDLTKKVEFDFSYNFMILNKASGTYTHHLISTLETELTGWLDFDISFVWDRTQNPTPESDGTVPKPDDFYLIFSLGIEF